MKRRSFVKKTMAAGALAGFPSIIPSSVLGWNGAVAPSNKAAIGLIACGNRAGLAGDYAKYGKSEIVAVCDPIDSRRLDFKKRFGGCDDYRDFRDLLARDDIDAVHIATADHWHVPISLYAAQAGKDMYTEKPLGISIEQDLKARDIVDKYERVFQYGAQQRSLGHVRLGIELVLNGHIGEVSDVYVWCQRGESGASCEEIPVPAGFDYDLWLGPAPRAPFCRDRCLVQGQRNGIFHIHDYAIGFIAGWGAHPMDMLQWWADNSGMESAIPLRYEGRGTIPTEGLFDTVTHWDVEGVYANGIRFHFMDNETAARKAPHPGVRHDHGTCFVGSEGWVTTRRGGWETSSNELRQQARDPGAKRLQVSGNQVRNFVDAVLTREQPVDNLHSAVLSDVATHLSEISVRSGKVVEWDPKMETIKDNELRKYMHRDMRGPWKLV
jgi:predicted dehydrogenase